MARLMVYIMIYFLMVCLTVYIARYFLLGCLMVYIIFSHGMSDDKNSKIVSHV